MIQAYAGNLLLVGITRGNVTKLTDGQPISVDVLPHRRVERICIMFGEDKPAILRALEAAGIEVPDAWKVEAAKDPS